KGRAAALACGQELKKRGPRGPVQANNMLEGLRREQGTLPPRCATFANNIGRRRGRDATRRCQGVVAGQGEILGCRTMAKRSVSRRCNAALDATYLRQ